MKRDALGILLASLILHAAQAQVPAASGGGVTMFGGSIPAVEQPPRRFATAEEHYRFLFDAANGGTQHTMATIPQWNGLWASGGNSAFTLFLEGGSVISGGEVRGGLLTPPYEEHFRARRAEMAQYGEQLFDNETRRVYIGAEHVNVDAQHSATGDSIGFWSGDELVIWTRWVNPADYTWGMP